MNYFWKNINKYTTSHSLKRWAVSLIDRYAYSFTQSANADSYLPTP